MNSLNILLECIERIHVFQFIAEKNDRLTFCDNSETLVEELFF